MINTLKPTLKLLNFNVTWHAQVMKDTLIRYKIFVLFAILTIAPTISGLEYILTLPTKSLLAPSAKISQYIIALFAYLSIAMAWLALQKNIISNQPWDKYLSTLPLRKFQKSIYEGTTLFIADYFIWIPLFLAAYLEIASQHLNTFGLGLVIEKCLTYITLIVLLQLAYKTQQFKVFILALLLESPILLIAKISEPSVAATILTFAMILPILLMPTCFRTTSQSLKSLTTSNIFEKENAKNFSSLFIFPLIQIKNLWDIKSELIFILIPLLMVYLISFGFLKYGQDNNLLTTIILSLMLVNAIILSNVFVRLFKQRNQLLPYFSSLPISKWGIFINDIIVIGLSLMIANLPILIIEHYFLGNKATPPQLAYGISAPLLFLAMTYMPQLRFKKYGFIISLIIMSFFIGCGYSLFAVTK
jgi:hypothetical protein